MAIARTTANWPPNISRLLDTGVIGINFEDRVVKGAGLYDIDRQARRISAIRKTAEQKGVELFINARTDVFFEHGDDPAQAVGEALDRAKAYAVAGASGYFVPGLVDDALIGRICEGVSLPVNVMVMEGVPSNARLAELGVARISYGPIPYIRAVKVTRARSEDGVERSRRAFGGLSHEQPANPNHDSQRRDAFRPHQLCIRWIRSGRALRAWRGVE